MLFQRFTLFCFLAAVVGCGPASSPSADPSSSTTVAEEETATQSNVDMKLVDAGQFASELAALEGKVVFIDMWATY